MKRMKHQAQTSIFWIYGLLMALFSAMGLLVYGLANWVLDTWGLLSVEEIVFHLKVPLEGTNTDMVVEGVNACVPLASLIFLTIFVIVAGTRSGRKKIAVVSLFLIMCISVEVGAQAAYGLYVELDVEKYLENQGENSTFIQDEYVDPRSVQLTFPQQKRNLIYIFLESMEYTYASIKDGGAYEFNSIPELTALANNNVSFSNTDKLGGGYPAAYSTWTMAALFAQTSGLPLKGTNSDGMNATLAENSSFSSTAYNLEDILAENGYKQCFMIGSDATFGGRRAYFNSHGECEIWDLHTAKELQKIPEEYYVWWGYEDAKLFSYAQEKLLELSASGDPFNLTMLTVDTHFEDGYVCELCQNEFGDNQYANVMACASRQIATFIEWIQQQPFYENTTIILCGDHLTMDSDYCEGLEDYERGVYNAFINLPEGLDISYEQTHNRDFSTMDMFPTTLAAMGVMIEGDKLGLGTNLFSDQQTLLERFGRKGLDEELQKKSTFYDLLINDIDY